MENERMNTPQEKSRRKLLSKQSGCLTKKDSSLEKFMIAYSPSRQFELAKNQEDCIFGNYPTLADLDAQYGKNASAKWIVPQLDSIGKFAGVKVKFEPEQMRELAKIISIERPEMKVSEFMLFVFWFKAGHYDKFYGSIDAFVITKALDQFFNPDYKYSRNTIMFQHYKRIENQI